MNTNEPEGPLDGPNDSSPPNMLSFDNPADNLFALANILSDLIIRTFKGHLEATHNITLAEWRVLNTLRRFPGRTAAEITNRWGLDKMTINRAIKRLINDGLILRMRDPSDLRSFRLELTANGSDIVDKVLPTAYARYVDYTACLSREEDDVLRKLLVKLITHVRNMPS